MAYKQITKQKGEGGVREKRNELRNKEMKTEEKLASAFFFSCFLDHHSGSLTLHMA